MSAREDDASKKAKCQLLWRERNGTVGGWSLHWKPNTVRLRRLRQFAGRGTPEADRPVQPREGSSHRDRCRPRMASALFKGSGG